MVKTLTWYTLAQKDYFKLSRILDFNKFLNLKDHCFFKNFEQGDFSDNSYHPFPLRTAKRQGHHISFRFAFSFFHMSHLLKDHCFFFKILSRVIFQIIPIPITFFPSYRKNIGSLRFSQIHILICTSLSFSHLKTKVQFLSKHMWLRM